MDPNENLEEQRDLSEALVESSDEEETQAQSNRLAELVESLDGWIMKGGFLPTEWELRCNGGLLKRAALAAQVYEEAIDGTESFEGELGVQFTYLFGAILKGTHITLDMSNDEENEVHQFFQSMFPPEHPVWSYIEVENLPEVGVSSA